MFWAQLKKGVGRAADAGAVTLVGAYLLLTMVVFAKAWYEGMLPQNWGEYEGNHGPWRHYQPARMLMDFSIWCLVWAIPCGVIGMFVGRILSAWMFAAAIALLFCDFLFLYWLVD